MDGPTATPAAPKPRVKDLTGVTAAAPYLAYEALAARLLGAAAAPAPADDGTVSLIVQRPAENARVVVDAAQMSVAGGMSGGGWRLRPERGTIDQICVMSTAAIRAVAGDDQRAWAEAGDQLFLDLDLGKGNLRVGDRVAVGGAGEGDGGDGGDGGGEGAVLLEVTPKPHNGCSKFARRYGVDALKVVMNPLGKERRLRGIYFRVVREGVVRKGDRVRKVPPEKILN